MHAHAFNVLRGPRRQPLALAIGLGLAATAGIAQAAGYPRLENPGEILLKPGPIRLQTVRDSMGLPGTPSPSATILITNLNDSGPGSLRDAILAANLTPFVHDELRFDPALAGGTLTLTSGSLLIGSPMSIRNLSLVPVTITSLPDGGAAGPNPGRLFLIDDGNDEVNSRISFEGLTLTGANTIDVIPGPSPHGLDAIDEYSANGAAILSAESVEIRRSQILGNVANSQLNSYVLGVVVAQGELVLEDSTVSGNSTMVLTDTPGQKIALGPLLATAHYSTLDPNVLIRNGLLSVNHSSIIGNGTYAVNTGVLGATTAVYPSFVIAGQLEVNQSRILDNFVAAGANTPAGRDVTSAMTAGSALGCIGCGLGLSDSRVSGNQALLVAGSGLMYSSTVGQLSGPSLQITRSEISDNFGYASALRFTGGVQALCYASAVLGLVPVAGISDSTLANNTCLVSMNSIVDGTAANAVGLAAGIGLGAVTMVGEVNILNSTISNNSTQTLAVAEGTTAGAFNLTLTATADTQGGGLNLDATASPAPSFAAIRGGGFPFVVNSTITNNVVTSITETVVNGTTSGTITRNETATAVGGGAAALNPPAFPALGGSILMFNQAIAATSGVGTATATGHDGFADFILTANNLVGDPVGTNIVDGVNNNIVGTTPLEPLKHNGGPTRTIALTPGSIAIDAGFNPYSTTGDQRGYGPRETGLAADIGAYECGAGQLPGVDEDLFIDDFDPSC